MIAYSTEIIMFLCVVSALTFFIADVVRIDRNLKKSRQETSRFPLFACRDKLVLLAVRGKVDENNPAWRSTYEGVNMLLGMDQKLNELDMLKTYFDYIVIMEKVPDFKEKIRKLAKEVSKLESDVPEFRDISSDIDSALSYLVNRRTNAWHRTSLIFIFMSFYAAKYILKDVKMVVRVVLAIRGLSRSFSATDLRSWNVYVNTDCSRQSACA